MTGKQHLDVGVGTGFYLGRAQFIRHDDIEGTLLDLNQRSLDYTSKRIQRLRPVAFMGGVYEVEDARRLLAARAGATFDSVALMFVMHCLPGNIEDKAAVIGNLSMLVSPGGVLFGTTILGRGLEHNAFGRPLMRLYN